MYEVVLSIEHVKTEYLREYQLVRTLSIVWLPNFVGTTSAAARTSPAKSQSSRTGNQKHVESIIESIVASQETN